MINIVIVEDEPKIREGLRILLDGTENMKCTGLFDSCEEMLLKIEILKPRIILMDIGLPGMSGIEGIKIINKILPDTLILVLTIHEENDMVFDALCAGAGGYLLKQTTTTNLIAALNEALEGGAPMSSHIARKVVEFFQNNKTLLINDTDCNYNLTEREKDILKALVDGLSRKAISDKFFISVETVRFHFKNIYRKLQVRTQAQVVAKALREGLIQTPSKSMN